MKFLYKSLNDLSIIALYAILVRVILYFIFDFQSDFQGGDSSYFLEVGRNILDNGIHGRNEVPSFIRPPLYSVFTGIVAKFSETAIFFYLVQSVLFIIFSFLVYFLLQKNGLRLAFFSALLIAISPFDAIMNGRVLSENLVTPFLMIGTLVFIYGNESKTKYLLAGALLGCAALTRDIYMLFPFTIILAGFYLKICWRYLLIFFLSFALIVAPWVYRNSQMPGGGLFLSKGILWINLWTGTWEQNADWTRMPNAYVPPPEALVTTGAEISSLVVFDALKKQDEEFFKKITIKYASEHPIKVINAWVFRYPLLWFGTRSDLNTSYLTTGSLAWYILKIIFYLINAGLICLGILGFLTNLRSRHISFVISFPLIYNSLIYIPLHNVETRYSLPVMPILTIYCIYFLLHIKDNKFIRWR
jgi:hypothetical protein